VLVPVRRPAWAYSVTSVRPAFLVQRVGLLPPSRYTGEATFVVKEPAYAFNHVATAERINALQFYCVKNTWVFALDLLAAARTEGVGLVVSHRGQ
jgi:hypothetical protein